MQLLRFQSVSIEKHGTYFSLLALSLQTSREGWEGKHRVRRSVPLCKRRHSLQATVFSACTLPRPVTHVSRSLEGVQEQRKKDGVGCIHCSS